MSQFVFESDKAHPTAWIAPCAIVVGDVYLGEEVSVWYNAVIRGDTETLRIGARTNIQDLSMLHADPGYPVIIGEDCTIGHRVIVHGAKIGNGSLIGMGAILLNGAEIGEQSLVGAGALVTEGKKFPARSLILGSPAKVVRELTEADFQQLAISSAHYVENAKKHRGS